jgi:hypothetical protein
LLTGDLRRQTLDLQGNRLEQSFAPQKRSRSGPRKGKRPLIHPWLTLQLHYLIFHGPVDLIVKGCRAIRVERVGAGRSINQAATLGFRANVIFATQRSKTFGAYLMGNDELFNDYFTGDSGFYVNEEMSHGGRKSGVGGRGIEGIADSVLKIFGI